MLACASCGCAWRRVRYGDRWYPATIPSERCETWADICEPDWGTVRSHAAAVLDGGVRYLYSAHQPMPGVVTPHSLLAQLHAAGGVLTIRDPQASVRAACRSAIRRRAQQRRLADRPGGGAGRGRGDDHRGPRQAWDLIFSFREWRDRMPARSGHDHRLGAARAVRHGLARRRPCHRRRLLVAPYPVIRTIRSKSSLADRATSALRARKPTRDCGGCRGARRTLPRNAQCAGRRTRSS